MQRGGGVLFGSVLVKAVNWKIAGPEVGAIWLFLAFQELFCSH